jgi:hypothetical protein
MFGRDSTSAIPALTCGTVWMPGAAPENEMTASPKVVVATSCPVRAGDGSSQTSAW